MKDQVATELGYHKATRGCVLSDMMRTRWRLIGPDGRPYMSPRPGTIGGHRRSRIYGRLDCPAALRAIARGGYVAERVFFAGESDATAAGYRPCAVCLPSAYAAWRATTRRAQLP